MPPYRLVLCPRCRNYALERSWCDVCNGRGHIKEDVS